jgi:hypothetical protein
MSNSALGKELSERWYYMYKDGIQDLPKPTMSFEYPTYCGELSI